MPRKGIAKEDGQEDNGEMDHVHRAVIDGLHHNVQSRVRLEKPNLNKKTSRGDRDTQVGCFGAPTGLIS